MARIRSTGAGGTATPAPPEPITSAAETTATQSQQPAVGGTSQTTSTAPSAISAQESVERRAEQQISGTARQAELLARRPPTGEEILHGATNSGLTQAETTQLQDRLNGMNADERTQEMRYLRSHVLSSPNADRALRTYMDVQDLRASNPDRLSADTVHTLTSAVADRRTNSSRGAEGIMGQDQAVTAARTLTQMPQPEFDRLQNTLDHAGQRDGRFVRGADAEAERSLILESVAARSDTLTNPNLEDQMRSATGQPSHAMADIEGYAADIRGMPRDQLIDQSTVLDIRDDNRLGALQQRFSHSCAPTSTQITRAESDPIYARQLHQDVIHGTSPDVAASATASEQSTMLTSQGGIAVARGTAGGSGVSEAGFENLLNSNAAAQTGVHYDAHMVADTPEARRVALDRMEQSLRRGQDVPMGVYWQGGGGHAMMVTDVRGQGDNRRFLVTDPADGRTSWVSGRALERGDTALIPGNPPSRGDLTSFYD